MQSLPTSRLIPIQQVASRLKAGQPLPFSVRDEGGQLLLARGHPLTDESMLQALLARGFRVDPDEVRAADAAGVARREAPQASPLQAFARLCEGLAQVLKRPDELHFLKRVREAAQQVQALTDRNADLMLFMLLRDAHDQIAHYGTHHAIHVACLCALLARRQGASADERDRAIGAALTMNVATIDLQSRLAQQATPLTTAQRQQVHDHPAESALMLRAAGLEDESWLSAVECHHEKPDGRGYPAGRTDPCDLSQLLRLTDRFSAMHSPRAHRDPLPAQQAARDLYMDNPGQPLAALIIKEFGIYPPGCHVRLASGETAIVVKRGENARTPLCAALTNRHGDALLTPLPRNTAKPEHAIVGSLPAAQVKVRVPAAVFFPEAA